MQGIVLLASFCRQMVVRSEGSVIKIQHFILDLGFRLGITCGSVSPLSIGHFQARHETGSKTTSSQQELNVKWDVINFFSHSQNKTRRLEHMPAVIKLLSYQQRPSTWMAASRPTI